MLSQEISPLAQNMHNLPLSFFRAFVTGKKNDTSVALVWAVKFIPFPSLLQLLVKLKNSARLLILWQGSLQEFLVNSPSHVAPNAPGYLFISASLSCLFGFPMSTGLQVSLCCLPVLSYFLGSCPLCFTLASGSSSV